ncbi:MULTISPECIES: DNA primase family protein [Convivina]|uniref:P4 family phage/plasmid primase-like protein n=2 Tax=Convivina TaxID=1697027 RepID=A0A2U1D5Y1_9LACO|nr:MULTISPECIES: phage/plasmid primase, P4 family [Convivina]SDB98197.1 putative DNA primase/helicase [Leuconostocaceae bacterium R-53105]PVY83085.1 P4 family phage/plasmid primase-like protein [Convivina intestini]CAH1849990.1 hypothetical protein R078138_00045 [Convivina sp. LMG 32447]CAH1856141.1 hypothetical protein LMG032447_01238 [Convivina sp. LMG 32447]CAH1856589.1 hypothetical protein R077811_01286 [Convivina intestini]
MPDIEELSRELQEVEQYNSDIPSWVYMNREGKVEKIDLLEVADLIKEQTHFFNTSNNLSGYYYNGQYWVALETKAKRDNMLRNEIAKLLATYRNPNRVTNALQNLLDTATRDDLIGIFEQRPALVSFKNTALDGDTMEMLPNSPSLYILGGFNFDIRANQATPLTTKLFNRVLGENSQFMLEFVGSMFRREYQPFQYLVIIQGLAGTGKSFLTEIIRATVGQENTASLSLLQLATEKFLTGMLYGKFANIKNDIESKFITATATIKNATGDDTMTAQFKGENGFQFMNHAKLLFTSNDTPHITPDIGIERRVIVIPAVGDKYTGAKQDKADYLKERGAFVYQAIKAQHEAIQRNSMSITPSIEATTKEWYSQGDDIKQWAEEHLQVCEGRRPTAKSIYFKFVQDFKDGGHKEQVTDRAFLKRLQEIGYTIKPAASVSQLDEEPNKVRRRIINFRYMD